MRSGVAGSFAAVALGALLGACQTSGAGATRDPPPSATDAVAGGPGGAPEPAAGPAPPPIDWAQGGDCLGQLRLLQQAARQDRLERSHEPPFAVVSSTPRTSLDWVESPIVPIVADLPLKSFEDAAAGALEAPCLLEVRPAQDLGTAYRVTDLEEVVSAYQSSVRSERNPDHEAAEARVRDAERDTKRNGGSGVLKVGDPLLDLVGLVVGSVFQAFGQLGGAVERDQAVAELKATPRSLDRPVYRAYSFERQLVRAGKEATIPVALHDRANGRVWQTEVRQREMRQLAILDGLDPRDRDYEQHRAGSMSWPEFEHWLQQPPQLPLSALVDALVETAGAAPRAVVAKAGPEAATVDLRSATKAPPHTASPADESDKGPEPRGRVSRTAAATDRRVDAVVRIDAGARQGGGFYVEPRLVLTTADVVGSASVIDVTTGGGGGALGLVVHSDPIRNIALVHLPRAGLPAPLYGGGPVAPEQPVEILELGGARAVVTGAVLRGAQLMVEGDEGTTTGAPVFLDNRVIGVVAGQRGGGRYSLIRIDDLYSLLDPEALAALP